MQIIKSTLFFCLCLLATQQVFAQNLATFLSGGNSRTWELRDITWNDGFEDESQEFSTDTEFIQNEDEATTIPETIIFKADGTCSLLYVAYYNDSDNDGDEDLLDWDWWLDGTWTVSGYDVLIVEENGYTWKLKGIQMDAENEEFDGGFDYYGFDSGIKQLGYYMEL